MKFTNGYWQKRKGLRVLHPVQLHSASAGEDSLTVLAATRPITRRDDTLDSALITVRCSSPMADVIRVEIAHFLGTRPRRPSFRLRAQPGPVEVAAEPAELTAGALTARFRAGDAWGLEFVADGR